MDFTPSPRSVEIADRVRAFVADVVVPAESRGDGAHEPAESGGDGAHEPTGARGHGAHGPTDALRAELQAAARSAGVFAPHVGGALGGLGLDMREQALVFEEA